MMPRCLVAWVLLLCLFVQPALASDNLVCRDAAKRAEQAHGLPTGLLLAIGRQESGRWDAAAGQVLPWPFSTNAAGVSRYFQTREEAISYVVSQQRSGVNSVDVGCFQINLKHHPMAFTTLEEAFDPEANARYAAHFLASLHAETGSWEAAVGRYHSATLALAEGYKTAVLGQWNQPTSRRMIPAEATEPFRGRVVGVIVQRPGGCRGTFLLVRGRPRLPHMITPTAMTPRLQPATWSPACGTG